MSNEEKSIENNQGHAPLAGVGGSSFRIVSDKKEFKFKCLCPYCGGDLTYRCDGWVEDDNGQWMVDSMTSECSTEPDIESDEWEDWFSNHSDMPYVYQLPVDMRVQDWINERYRFALD